MISKNSPLPMWLAPFLGVVVGAGLGLTTAAKAGDANISLSAATTGGAVIGGIAGLIVLLVELKRQPESPEAEISVAGPVTAASATTAAPQSGIVRFGTTVFSVIILFSGIITEVYQLRELRRARSSVNWPKVKAQIVEFKTYEQSRGRRQSNPSFLILPSFRYTVDGHSISVHDGDSGRIPFPTTRCGKLSANIRGARLRTRITTLKIPLNPCWFPEREHRNMSA